MKILTWNCNGALRKKTAVADSLDADILIIQECEDPAESTNDYQAWAGNYLWVGSSKNRGLGVFPKNEHKVRSLGWNSSFQIDGLYSKSPSARWGTNDLELFLPFSVDDHYTIIGVWTKGHESHVFGYMGQFWKYLQLHRTDIPNKNTMIVGDFNSNSIWDKNDRWWNHSDVVAELSELNIESLYHYQYTEKQGKESVPTFFLNRKENKPYHIDYAFLSKDLLPHSQLTVGKREEWVSVSDHMPLCVKISL
jgi:exodeoxyribonuclease-3